MQAGLPSLSSSPSLNARSCCDDQLTTRSGSDQQFQRKQRERRREGEGDGEGEKNVVETERPSLSSSPSLNAYVQPPPVVHDHRKIVRNCSDEPTTRVQRSEPESDRQEHQKHERKREGEVEKVVEVGSDINDSGGAGGGFEFSFNCGAAPSPISADQIFHNGKIKPTLPIYEVASFCPKEEVRKSSETDDLKLKIAVDKMVKTTSRRKALRRLFIEERSHSHSSPSTSASSSETDEASESSVSAANGANSSISELDSVPPDSYCVWKPKTTSLSSSSSASASLGSSGSEISRKSESAGSSKRWKLKDLLTRNNSERDVNSQSQSQSQSSSKEAKKSESGKNEKVTAPQLARKMAMKEGGERRRSYLPYRQELVGIFGSSGSGRNLQRF